MASRSKRRIVFLGPPNSGKGTQATLLSDYLDVPAISTGEMLRAAVEKGTSLGLKVKDVMARGGLVSDDLMADIVRERLASDDVEDGFILDGYPRTQSQAVTLQAILSNSSDLDAVLLVEASREVLVSRALARGREDDHEAVVQERLRVYERKTASLVNHYDKEGLLHRIEGDKAINTVHEAILVALDMV